MTQALPLSQSQQANVTSSPDHRTQPSEATAEWVQGQSLTISTVRSASLNRFASQQLRSAPADLLAHSIHSSATQSGQFEPASSQRTVLPQQSGAITRLLQNDEGTNLVESHAVATGRAAAAQPRLARWPNHSNDPQEQQQQQQQQQQPPSQQQYGTTEPLSRQRTRSNASLSLQTPSLSSMPPLVAGGDDSIRPSSGKKRSTRFRSSKRRPSSRNKLLSGSFSSPSELPSHWQTLGDVLQDISLNDITVKGCPLRKGEVHAVAPLTPMDSPFQLVDTRPLAYFTMQSQENQTPAADLPPISPPASFLMPSEHQPQGSQTPWQAKPHLQHLCQVHYQSQMPAQPLAQAQLDPSQRRQMHRAHVASQAETTVSSSAHNQAAFLPTPAPSLLQEAPRPAGGHAVSILQLPKCTSGAVLSTWAGFSQPLQVANYESFPHAPRSSTPAQSRTPFQTVELALNKLFGNPSRPANGSGQPEAQMAALTTAQPDPASDFPGDGWQGGSHILAHQQPQGSLLDAVWHQEALLAPYATSADQSIMLARSSLPTGWLDALVPTSAAQEPYAVCDFHWQPVHQQQLPWSATPAPGLPESSQDMQVAQSPAATVSAHQTRQPQPDKTNLQLESPSQALANAAWQQQHLSEAPPLFGTPAESPIMQDGHGVFDRPQLVSSPFPPSKATKQLLPAFSQQGPGIASQADSAAMPGHPPIPASSMLPSPFQVQDSSATAQHPFLHKRSLPHALTMIPVPNHPAPQPAPTCPVNAAGQSRLQPSTQDVFELEQAELPEITAVDEHRSMAEAGQPVQAYTLQEIASSAQHLLKEFEDATITAATEYRVSHS